MDTTHCDGPDRLPGSGGGAGGSHTRREAAHRQGVTKHFKKQALSWRVHSCTCVSTRMTGCRTCVRACEVQVCWRICCMFTCVCRHVGIVHVCGCRGPMEGRAEPGFLEKVPECKDIVSPWPLPGGDQDLPPARTSVHPKTHATAAASPGQPFSSKGRGGGTGQRASSCPQPEPLWEEPGQPPPSPGPMGSEQGAARSEGPCQGAGPWARPSPFLGCPLGAELPKGSGSCTSCDQARLELPPRAGAQQKRLVVHEPPQNS